jgi:hypothetical protein
MKLIGKVVTLKIESITITLSKEMETFATEIYWLADQQKVKENHPKILKRSLTLVMLEMLEKQIAKYPTYVEWAYQTIARFWEMSRDSNIRQCWTEQEWYDWVSEGGERPIRCPEQAAVGPQGSGARKKNTI